VPLRERLGALARLVPSVWAIHRRQAATTLAA
jgi:hypothetical protein